jgi:MYXO-CTERM domain-containing protein
LYPDAVHRLLYGAALLVSLGSPRRADACSCGIGRVTLSPVDNQPQVPVNGVVIATFDYAGTASIELRNVATQEVVPITQDNRRGDDSGFSPLTIIATPMTPLAPNTAYQITAHADTLTTDKTTTFTTGTATDTTPPIFAGLVAMSPETMTWPIIDPNGIGCAGSCTNVADGHISRVHFAYADPDPDTVYLAVQIRRADSDTYVERTLFNSAKYIGAEVCGVRAPVLDPGVDYCARVVAYDVAGNIAGADAEVCTAAKICAPAKQGICEPADACDPLPPPEGESSGCTTTPATPLLALLALFGLRPKRRR